MPLEHCRKCGEPVGAKLKRCPECGEANPTPSRRDFVTSFDDQAVELPCPSCAGRSRRTLAWLREEPEFFECDHCGSKVYLDGIEEFTDSLDEIETAEEELRDSVTDPEP